MRNIPIVSAVLVKALDALEYAAERVYPRDNDDEIGDVINTLREALAQPQQEPVAVHQWRKPLCCNWYDGHPDNSDGGGPYETRVLYTSPPARKPLTDDDMDALVFDCGLSATARDIARAIEAAHGIRTHYELRRH